MSVVVSSTSQTYTLTMKYRGTSQLTMDARNVKRMRLGTIMESPVFIGEKPLEKLLLTWNGSTLLTKGENYEVQNR